MDFIQLHNHSLHSILDGVASVEDYAKYCEKYKMPGMALTEHGHMGSVPDFLFTFKEYGLKPIIGCEIYYNDYEPFRKKLVDNGISIRSKAFREKYPDKYYRIVRNRHLTVLAKNKTGYENLIKLTTEGHRLGSFGAGRTKFNRIWFDLLNEYKEGLIILSGCLNGPISHELRIKYIAGRDGTILQELDEKKNLRRATRYIEKFVKSFGDDYYIELQMPGIPSENGNLSDIEVFKLLWDIAEEYNIKKVITNDCHYIKRKDFEIQKIMMAIAQGTTVDDPGLFHVNSSEQYFKTSDELQQRCNDLYGGVDLSECFNNTMEIFDKVEEIDVDTNIKIPTIEDADRKIRQMVINKAKSLGLDKLTRKFVIDEKEVTYMEQIEIELKRFEEKGFSSYFYITADLINYGKNMGWPFSPRGSAAGSLVCYLLGIHNIDPMKWGLSFDRFLSPSRGGYNLKVTMD